ncbi:MAG: hypothetical protein WAK93_14910 [Solirubrobacteraceae bacterium]
MSDATQNATSIDSTATRARRGATAVIAQYIQDLSEVQSALTRQGSAVASPCTP